MWTCPFVGHHQPTWMMVFGWSGCWPSVCLTRLPLSWSLGCREQVFVGAFLSVDISMLLVSFAPRSGIHDENLKNAQSGVP